MKLQTKLFYIVFSLLLLSCNYKEKHPALISQGDTIQVPAGFQTNCRIDSLFSEIVLLPLETKNGCEITEIEHFQFVDSFILVNDGRKRLLVFNNNGKYLWQIGSRGVGPGEYLEVRDFLINDKKEIEVLDFKKIEKYTLEGKHLTTLQFDFLKEKRYINPTKFCLSPAGGYFLWGGTVGISEAKPDLFMMYRTDPSISIQEGFFPIEHGGGGSYYRFSSYRDIILIDPILGDYALYQINGSGKVSPRYYVDFGSKKYSGDIRFSHDMSASELEALDQSVMQMMNFLETDEWVHVDFVFQQKLYALFYHKNSKRKCVINVADCIKQPEEFSFLGARQTYGNSLVSPIEASWIRMELDKLSAQAKRKWRLEQWESIKEDDNPILVFYRFR